jgi:UDP-N-acetylmuramoyl-L-alanyl-D-glutamate--2,6-diaminopimelate ligase
MTVADARVALSVLSTALYGDPSERLQVVGVTGTNGKTTTTYLVASIFERAGIRCGRIGTIGYDTGMGEITASRTTPEAPDVQRMLAEMADRGCGACAMEVSSHALALARVDGTRFAAAVFTNLTRDHLDFHRDMEDYFQAKRRLFDMLPSGAPAIVNLDDPRGRELAATVRRPISYAIGQPADVRPGDMSFSLDGLIVTAETPRGAMRLRSRLVGRPHVYNVLAAATTALALDLPTRAIEEGVAGLESVPGRFQKVSGGGDDVTVVVDYAHTDDALRNLLETARPLSRGRIITVFGCGGDRDRSKRPLMGAVATRLSDLVVVTSDNPRSEDPQQIIEDVMRGIATPASRAPGRSTAAAAPGPAWIAIVDRREAIERAIADARPGDVVLIAGKGHERYQEIGDRVLPFDDVEVARHALEGRRPPSRVM